MSIIPSRFCFGDGVDQPPHLVAKADFSDDRTRADGLCVYCRECNAARQRAWKRANPEKVWAAKKTYLKMKRERDHGGAE